MVGEKIAIGDLRLLADQALRDAYNFVLDDLPAEAVAAREMLATLRDFTGNLMTDLLYSLKREEELLTTVDEQIARVKEELPGQILQILREALADQEQ